MTHTDIQKKNIATIQMALKNAFAANFEVLAPIIADDFTIYEAEGLPFGGVFKGMEGYVKCMKGIADFFDNNKTLEPPHFVPDGDNRVLMMTGIDGHIRKNGQPVKMPTISTWDFKDGKILTVRPYFFDTKKVADLAAM
jgi:ketosteroid isomerase-like protein